MTTPEREEENIKRKIEQGDYTTFSKALSAIASLWNWFVRTKDDKENIILYVQCVKCLSVLAYQSAKTSSMVYEWKWIVYFFIRKKSLTAYYDCEIIYWVQLFGSGSVPDIKTCIRVGHYTGNHTNLS